MSTYVAVFALILAYIAVVAAYLALRTLAKLRRATALLSRGTRTGGGKQSLIEATLAHAERTTAMAEEIVALRAYIDSQLLEVRDHADAVQRQTLTHLDDTEQQLRKDVVETTQLARAKTAEVTEQALAEVAKSEQEAAGALRNTALVRFDAFPGTSGRMSFALALLDDNGTGVTISSLAGQTDTRVYAKGVVSGKAPQGEHELSPEESQAVASALARSRTRPPVRKAS